MAVTTTENIHQDGQGEPKKDGAAPGETPEARAEREHLEQHGSLNHPENPHLTEEQKAELSLFQKAKRVYNEITAGGNPPEATNMPPGHSQKRPTICSARGCTRLAVFDVPGWMASRAMDGSEKNLVICANHKDEFLQAVRNLDLIRK